MTLPSCDELAAILAEGELPVPPKPALSALLLHSAEMLRWNRAIRLTAVTDPLGVAVKHVADSLSLLRFSPFEGEILDFGSGAGYPGIPLAICLPACRVTLLEAAGKKCSFLSHIRSRLALSNVEVVHGHLGKNSLPVPGERYDHVVTRATLPQEEALSLLSPLLRRAGRLLLMEGRSAPAEISSPAGMVPGRVRSFPLPRGMGERTVREFLRISPAGRRSGDDPRPPFTAVELSRVRERYSAVDFLAAPPGSRWGGQLNTFEEFLREGPRIATELRRTVREGGFAKEHPPSGASPLGDLLLETFPLDVPTGDGDS